MGNSLRDGKGTQRYRAWQMHGDGFGAVLVSCLYQSLLLTARVTVAQRTHVRTLWVRT